MNRKRTQGFTLIEVLVVIAIISVLATILIPSFNGARKKPYDTAALQCGKAIVTAQVTYSSEHNNTAAGSTALLGSDVAEQCTNVQVTKDSTPPAGMSVAVGGDGNIGTAGLNYAFDVWSTNGTSIYTYNKDVLTDRFRKIN